MSSTCDNCDCADKSQCVKKGRFVDVEILKTEKSYFDEAVEMVVAGENDGKCKCGSDCKCVNCGCGGH